MYAIFWIFFFFVQCICLNEFNYHATMYNISFMSSQLLPDNNSKQISASDLRKVFNSIGFAYHIRIASIGAIEVSTGTLGTGDVYLVPRFNEILCKDISVAMFGVRSNVDASALEDAQFSGYINSMIEDGYSQSAFTIQIPLVKRLESLGDCEIHDYATVFAVVDRHTKPTNGVPYWSVTFSDADPNVNQKIVVCPYAGHSDTSNTDNVISIHSGVIYKRYLHGTGGFEETSNSLQVINSFLISPETEDML